MLQTLLHGLGFGLCHQLPARSFFGGGVQAPVCARDEGIYFGVLLGLGMLALLHRGKRPSEFANRLGMVVAIVLVGFMAWDGVTEYAGLRSTNNELRLITGLCAGYAIAMYVGPMLNGELLRRSDPVRVLEPGWRLGLYCLSIPVAYAVIFFGGPYLGVVYPTLVGLGIIGALVAVNLVVVALLPPWERSVERPPDLVVPGLVALALAAVEIAGAALLKLGLLALVSHLV